MKDELIITKSACARLEPWFDSFDELEQWAIAQLLLAADEMRLLREPPADWVPISNKPLRESLHYVLSDGPPSPIVLLYDVVKSGVVLNAAFTDPIPVHLTRHARERLHERVDQLEPDPQRRRRWLAATVDRALRADSLTLEAPSWAASAPLRQGFGWTTRKLAGEEVALLVAAPHYDGGSWNVVTVLSRSTAISIVGRFLRVWKRSTRLLGNRIRYRSAPPVREAATRPPRLGDLSRKPRRPHSFRPRN
ncbi:MAG: hypothetical protein H7287_03420 [Thermoleophilia bacterium]|nr:hypothetical protein [Thermoleophilia bacterium]